MHEFNSLKISLLMLSHVRKTLLTLEDSLMVERSRARENLLKGASALLCLLPKMWQLETIVTVILHDKKHHRL
ncbi:hypothetical protein AC1031_021940 [Aphanomyces cochlioides]|nr:hypothetical protein AC1031_021940 [Aphanomyces cochlioides]